MIAASNWIDREIYGKNGNQFGEVDDLVIKRNGKVKKVTIEVGGFLDIGDKLVAVSLSELQSLMEKGNGKIVLDTTEEQMEKRKEFDYYRQGLRPDYYYRPRYYRGYDYRRYPPPYVRSMPYGPPPANRQAQPYPDSEPYDWAFSPTRYLASAFIDRQVINENGDYIGRVSDLLIDTRSGKVEKIVLDVDDVRGDDSRVAIVYEPPGFTAYGIVCDISRQEISKLPSYGGDSQ
jgi:sporulation protein YlmC with PRC-barrel domain